jgi:hypothetical protein
MAKGTLRLGHRKSCALHDSAGALQFDSRKCSCSPRVIGRLNGPGSTLG